MRGFVGGVNVVIAGLVVAAALAAGGGLLAGMVPSFDVLTHLAPVYGVVGLLGLVWAVLAGRGPVAAAALLAAVASAALILPEVRRDTGPAAPPDAAGQVKVIQINALRTNADVRRVADWLIAQRPDFVMIAEARPDLRDALRAAGWKTAGAGGAQMIFTRERYLVMHRPARRAGALTFVNATYATASGPVEALTTHVGWPTHRTVGAELARLEEVVGQLPRERMILAGDFNAAGWSREMRRLDRSLGLIRRDRAAATWPAEVLGMPWPLPFAPIDHIYAGPGWATVKVERGPWVGSDHYPLVVTLAPVAPP
ncbi:endonuclease/exonuclease/phosphatase family protein [Phenylobacterium sp.]|uniref:endonuclease/exonuclease/phosphatase family protein n=1 Tax=Phenylobacterium sp. TaxID=1871053 RepID=UPI0025E73667|nr:endonuclease/exonuclease/phosphatase family protein [Phenylobacterium sp.]MBX3482359.1 endonuclease/exonuclease/phosphatase family protein [Phenylobacterium sp.]